VVTKSTLEAARLLSSHVADEDFPIYPIKLAPTSCTHIEVIVTRHGVAEVLPRGRELWERETRERTSPNHAAREGCDGGGVVAVGFKELLVAILTLILDGVKKKHSQ